MDAPEKAAKRVRGPARPFPLSPVQVGVLFALDQFRLLTAAQGVRLGLERTEARMLALLRPLIGAKLVAHSSDALVSGVTRLPRMHYLTPKGAKVLGAVIDDQVNGARRRFGETNEVLHRRGVVDIHIALHLWCAAAGFDLANFMPEFEPGGKGGRRKATVLPELPQGAKRGLKYPPDALALVDGRDGIRRGVFVELERGGARGDLQRFRRKLPLLRELAGGQPLSGSEGDRLDGWIEKALGTPQAAARFVVVFKDERMRDAALKQWPDPGSEDWADFYVKALSELADDFNGGWLHPDGSRRPLFPA